MARSSLSAMIFTLIAAILMGFAVAQSPAASPTKSPPVVRSPAVKPPIYASSPESAASSPIIENSYPPLDAVEPAENGGGYYSVGWRGSMAVGVVAFALVV